MLFILYINPMFRLNITSSIPGYADDIKLINTNSDDLIEDCNLIVEWMKHINFEFNTDKIGYMIFSLHECIRSPIILQKLGVTVWPMDYHEDLGILFDCRLSYAKHVENLSNKLKRRIGFTRRYLYCRPIDNSRILKMWFYATFLSTIYYGLSIYASASEFILRKIEKQYMTAIKLVEEWSWRDNSSHNEVISNLLTF